MYYMHAYSMYYMHAYSMYYSMYYMHKSSNSIKYNIWQSQH